MIEAEAGLMYITGEEDGTPVKVGVAVTGKQEEGNAILENTVVFYGPKIRKFIFQSDKSFSSLGKKFLRNQI